jgi:hypothetical protein
VWCQKHYLAGVDYENLSSREAMPPALVKFDGLLMEPLIRTGGENHV